MTLLDTFVNFFGDFEPVYSPAPHVPCCAAPSRWEFGYYGSAHHIPCHLGMGRDQEPWNSDCRLYSRSLREERDLFQSAAARTIPYSYPGHITNVLDDTSTHRNGRHIPTAVYSRDPLSPPLMAAMYSLLLLAALARCGPLRTEDYLPLPKWRRKASRPSLLDLIGILRKRIAEHPGALELFGIKTFAQILLPPSAA